MSTVDSPYAFSARLKEPGKNGQEMKTSTLQVLKKSHVQHHTAQKSRAKQKRPHA